MLGNFIHYFLPHESNNYRAKLLHHRILLVAVTILFLGSFLLSNFKNNFAAVLGDSIDISVQKLLLLTNQKREENGLPPLVLNENLLRAADNKAKNMLLEGYWAHNAPDGKTPWNFIKQTGYNYVYAGENLARGFTSSQEVVDAWMASSKHRENLLSPNYREVGFAIESGKLNGETTILVVEELGSQTLLPIASKTSSEQGSPLVANTINNEILKKPFASVLAFSSNVDKTVLSFFIFALFLDMIAIERKKIVRFVGHNLDHILFLLTIALLISLISKGVIL